MKKLLMLLLAVVCLDVTYAEEGDTEAETSAWAHSSQLGIALSGGNSDAQTYSVKQETSYRWTMNVLRSTGHFLTGRAAGVESANNWDLTLRYERELSERFSIYGALGIEGDRFSGYDSRINAGLGGKYWIVPGDKKANYLFAELGYQHQKQQNVAGTVPATVSSNFIRTYAEGGKALAENIGFKMYVEVLPDLSQSQNLLVNFEPSLNVGLSNHFSLKLAFTGKYDGLPNTGKKSFDYQYTTSLVANY